MKKKIKAGRKLWHWRCMITTSQAVHSVQVMIQLKWFPYPGINPPGNKIYIFQILFVFFNMLKSKTARNSESIQSRWSYNKVTPLSHAKTTLKYTFCMLFKMSLGLTFCTSLPSSKYEANIHSWAGVKMVPLFYAIFRDIVFHFL